MYKDNCNVDASNRRAIIELKVPLGGHLMTVVLHACSCLLVTVHLDVLWSMVVNEETLVVSKVKL